MVERLTDKRLVELEAWAKADAEALEADEDRQETLALVREVKACRAERKPGVQEAESRPSGLGSLTDEELALFTRHIKAAMRQPGARVSFEVAVAESVFREVVERRRQESERPAQALASGAAVASESEGSLWTALRSWLDAPTTRDSDAESKKWWEGYDCAVFEVRRLAREALAAESQPRHSRCPPSAESAEALLEWARRVRARPEAHSTGDVQHFASRVASFLSGLAAAPQPNPPALDARTYLAGQALPFVLGLWRDSNPSSEFMRALGGPDGLHETCGRAAVAAADAVLEALKGGVKP